MAIRGHEVRITYTVKDKATGEVVRISKAMEKGLTRVTRSITNVSEKMGKTIRETRTYTDVQKTLSRRMIGISKKLSQWGRKIGFTGFILGFTARRILRSFTQLGKQFTTFIGQIGDIDKALTFLSSTLEKLAMADMLTPKLGIEIVNTFQEWFDAARKFEGVMALLTTTLAPFGTAILQAVTPALLTWVEKLREVIAAHPELLDKVREAASAVMKAMTPAILGLIERLPQMVDLIIQIAPLLGAFAQGLLEGATFVLQMVAAVSKYIPFGKQLALWMGRLLPILIAIGGPLSLFGSLLSSLGLILGPLISLFSSVAGILISTGPWGIAIAAAIVAIGLVIKYHKELYAWIQKVYQAWKRFGTYMQRRFGGVPTAPAAPLGEAQFGGPIGKTGMYYLHAGEYVQPARTVRNYNTGGNTFYISGAGDPRQVAQEVARILGRRVRSAMILP